MKSIRYDKKGAVIIADFCLQRKNQCTVTQVVLQLTHFVFEVLRLMPPATSASSTTTTASVQAGTNTNATNFSDGLSSSSSAPATAAVSMSSSVVAPTVQIIARQPSWMLLNDDTSLQVNTVFYSSM